MAEAPSSSSDSKDKRGFTTGANDHAAIFPRPTLDSIGLSWQYYSRKGDLERTRSAPVLTPPSISPEDLSLDLEKTLVSNERPGYEASSDSNGTHSTGEPSASMYSDSESELSLHKSTSTPCTPNRIRRKSSLIHSIFRRGRSESLTSLETTTSISSAKALKRELEQNDIDPDSFGLIHVIMTNKYKKPRKRQKLLLALLTYSQADINLRTNDGSTALHKAVEEGDLECAKILVSFGANVNSVDQHGKTPLDLLRADIGDMESAFSISSTSTAVNGVRMSTERKSGKRSTDAWLSWQSKREKMIEFLKSIGGVYGDMAHISSSAPEVMPFPRVPLVHQSLGDPLPNPKANMEILDWETHLTSQYSALDRNIHQRLQNTSSAGEASFSSDEAISLAHQLQEMHKFKRGGSRILCLDGGGIRGLVQIEVLSQLENKTGRKITELFDWIIGTSTGAVIALGLVYAKKSIAQLRQLYFRMKDEIFGQTRHGGVSFNTEGLERVLKEEFTEHTCMDDVNYPRVLISAVKKETINLKLHFFNNCFHDEYCKHWPVWKVARYTSAGPVMFGEADDYVDGGLLANNPSESGLTRIQEYYRSRGEKLPISLVVSIGSGKYPIKELGRVDYLFFGSQGWFDPAHLKDRAANLMSLLSYALVDTGVSSSNCKSRCEEQGIRYFRINPRMNQVVDSGETDITILLNMILQAKKEINQQPELANLILCFHDLSEACRRLHAHLNGEDCTDD